MHHSDKPANFLGEIKELSEDCAASEQGSGQPIVKKRLKFRPRLWNEPPELDYSDFEPYDAVQKEFKAIGGHDLEWRTKFWTFGLKRVLPWIIING